RVLCRSWLLREFAKRLQGSIQTDGESEPAPAAAEPPAAEAVAGEAAATGSAPQPGPEPEASPPPEATPTRPIEPAEPIQGLSLAGGVLADRLKSNPVPLVIGFLLALLVFRRRRRSS